jgi:hypothetical protein
MMFLMQGDFLLIIYKTDNGLGRGGSGVIDEYIPNDAEGQLRKVTESKLRFFKWKMICGITNISHSPNKKT